MCVITRCDKNVTRKVFKIQMIDNQIKEYILGLSYVTVSLRLYIEKQNIII